MNILALTSELWAIESVVRAERPGESWTCLVDGHSDQSNVRQYVDQLKPRYIFVLHWSKKIPADLLAQSEFINFHCTPLPYGRGGSPIENMILTGHDTTSMTAHRMTENLDAGPIYLMLDGISLIGSRAAILARFVEPCAKMMREIIDNPRQPHDQASLNCEVLTFKRLTPKELAEFWGKR